jgi:HK97 family phage major capsid protein
MGRLAELYEKKANGTITDAELKEYNQLLKEAELARKDAEGDNPGTNPLPESPNEPADGDPEGEVDKLAQRFADGVTSKLAPVTDKLDNLLKGFDANGGQPTSVQDKGASVIVDPKLGRKTVSELNDIRVQIPERKSAGKKVIEVSMKTVHFANALLTKNVEKLQLLSEGTAADGGYLVPEEFANMIIEDIRDLNVMRQIAAPPMTISGDTLHIPSLVSRPKATFRAEKAVKNTSTATFGENVLTPYSLAVIVGMSREFANDASLGVSGSVVNYVAGLMAVSLAEREEKAFWVGSGSGEPTGVDGGAYTLRTVAAGAGASDAAKADAIVTAFQRTPQGYRNRAVWVANSQALEEIARVKDTQGRYLLTDLASGPTQTLRGRPVYEQNNLAGGVALFGDFSYYQIVDREGVTVDISTDATVAGQSAFERNLTFVRVEKRVDAELLLPAAVTKVTGLGTP